MPGSDQLDLEGRLRRLPDALAVEPGPGLLEGVVRQGRRRRRLRRAGAAAVIVVLLGGVLATRALVVDRTAGQTLGPGRAQDATAAQLAGGRGRALAPNPVVDRFATAARAWTGEELIVWGGVTRDRLVHADGAAYDPRTGRWRPVPPAPQAQTLDKRDGGAVWTGQELLIWGGTTPVAGERFDGSMRPGDGLAYDPARRTWRLLPAPPSSLQPRSSPAVWTGRELLVVDTDPDPHRQVAGGGLRAATYNPTADRWHLLPPSPRLSGQLLERTVLWAGTRLLVWSFWNRPGDGTSDSAGANPDGVDLWAYDPASGRWTVLPSPSGRVRALLARSSLAWTGQEILAVQHDSVIPPGQTLFGGRYDPDNDRWTPIATPPQRVEFRNATALVWTGAALVANGLHAYDPATDRWWALPAPGDWTWTGLGLVRPLGGGGIAMVVPAR